jgi:hypothetical protein
MINLNRPTNAPRSLERPEIQRYLKALQEYREGVIDAEPTKPGSYRHCDLLNAFRDSFFSKCWLTERRFEDAAELEVDHFVPQAEAPERIYDWTNLLPIDPKTNRIRPKKMPRGGYLDPCDPKDDVETEIQYILLPDGQTIRFAAVDSSNQKACNSVELLDLVHNGRKGDVDSHRSTLGLRECIRRRREEISLLAVKYLKTSDPLEKTRTEFQLRHYFSKQAEFTMLMRHSEIGQLLREFHQD